MKLKCHYPEIFVSKAELMQLSSESDLVKLLVQKGMSKEAAEQFKTELMWAALAGGRARAEIIKVIKQWVSVKA